MSIDKKQLTCLCCSYYCVLSSTVHHSAWVKRSDIWLLASVQSCAQVFQSKDSPDKTTTPEEFIRMTKGITTATAKAVAAGNSAQQEDVIATANLSRKAISDMLTTCKVLVQRRLAGAASCQRARPAEQQIGHPSAGTIFTAAPSGF